MQSVIKKFMPQIMDETLSVENKPLNDEEYKTTFKVNDIQLNLKLKRV